MNNECGLVKRSLGAPVEAGKIGIFSVLDGSSVGLLGFALRAPLFLLTLLHLAGFFAVAFRERRFSWSSDDVLLGAWDAPFLNGPRVLFGGAPSSFAVRRRRI